MKWLLTLLVVGMLGLSAWGVWKWTRHPAEAPEVAATAKAQTDPRLTWATPYRNVRPDVRYVGDGQCAGCHPLESRSFHEHPMGRSMALAAQAEPVERYDANAHNPFEKFGFNFLVERSGRQIVHRVSRPASSGQAALTLAQEVAYVLGSGTHGRAYVSNVDNYLFQTPINWFSQGKRWDLAPNMGEQHRNHFFRPVDAVCIFCHANAADPIAGSVNHYRSPLPQQLAIGCERCHGPAELHVARRSGTEPAEEPDNTIVNPRRLEPGLREAVCQQCHLQGRLRILRRGRQTFDYRPGLPLHLFWSIFLPAPDQSQTNKAVSHVEQMYASRCFRESNSSNKLGCISCHDPHVFPRPAEKTAFYRQRCLTCHADKHCTLLLKERTAQNGDSCYQCHMPRMQSSDVAHTAKSDHRIPRRPDQPFRLPPAFARRLVDEVPFVHFHQDLINEHDVDVRRDLAVGLVDLAESLPRVPAKQQFVQIALPLLDASLQAAGDDVPALQARGYALWHQGFREEAMASFQAALAGDPKHELTLSYAAQLATAMGRPKDARSYWQRALGVNPLASSYRCQLARLYATDNDWPRALEQIQRALEINPMSTEARVLLVGYHVENGHKDKARAEFDKLMLLDPPDAEALRKRFAEELKH
jgi:tetratricopeptide (TPR) repeat protein